MKCLLLTWCAVLLQACALGDNEIGKNGITDAGAEDMCDTAVRLRQGALAAMGVADAAAEKAQAVAAAVQIASEEAAAADLKRGNEISAALPNSTRAEEALAKARHIAKQAAKTALLCGSLAGQISQWIMDMGSAASKPDSGAGYIKHSGETFSGGTITSANTAGEWQKEVPSAYGAIPENCNPTDTQDVADALSTLDTLKEASLTSKVDPDDTTQSSNEVATGTTCPLTSGDATSHAGIYRKSVEWAGLWTVKDITQLSSGSSVTITVSKTRKLEEAKTAAGALAELAKNESDTERSNKQEKSWKTICAWKKLDM
ncbi:hypothetical protein, conserved in T. vivax [Trypanosoma vivax Y486]|uniref:Trypanosome variant surface glycoprotein A-type N-terminal domain-containing protein n=1 Tax=Trypanosoma vivax (strain Y486) TaxID=1055687 RepID=F9WKH2_TRYVY|nr:hypothetical protein, conserved in T. vivax [Trypanosoma vivax Y486]|eukprot:CCD17992.1 hypothetical protein, conserved in T. vivax [Trypanosoma vivax Y486]